MDTKGKDMEKRIPKYDETFKKNLLSLHQNGKSQSELCREYGVSMSALSKWVRLYAQVKLEDDTIVTAQQIKELRKRNALLEEENLILKKAIAIFTPHSNNA
jgi:transposase